MFLTGLLVSGKTPPRFKAMVEAKDWHGLYVILSMGTKPNVTVPSEDDIRMVGEMSPGLRNANVILAMADAEPKEDSKAKFREALDTHCWDKVAETIQQAMADKATLPFSGADLHQAYAPEDQSGCSGPSGFEKALGETIAAGLLVGAFFSSDIPNFFENDFAGFFANTMPDFFGGPFSDFFVDLGDSISDGFVDFGEATKGAFEKVADNMDPTGW